MPTRVLIAALVALTFTGCYVGHRHRHSGKSYKMTQGQIDYLTETTAFVEEKTKFLEAQGKTQSELLLAQCEMYDGAISNAPKSSAFTSAKKVLKNDQRRICKDADRAKKLEERAKVKEERDARYALAMEGRKAAQEADQKRQEEEAKREMAYKTKLQGTIAKVGGIECQVISFEHLGPDFGSDIANVTASGTFVAVLAKCTNRKKRTKQVDSDNFALVDGAGNQYAVDSRGSFYANLNLTNEKQRTPDFLDLHPGIKTSIVCVFDVPESILEDPGLRFYFGKADFPLAFPD